MQRRRSLDNCVTVGVMFGPDGKLYGCQNGKKRIVAITRDGSIYFTDPPGKQVWYIPPGGKPRVVDTGLGYAKGHQRC